MGTAHLLFPPGVEDIRELPAPYFEAIRTTFIYLGFEEMPEEDRPPQRIWQDAEALKEHFEQVKLRRKQGTDPNSKIEGPIEEPVQNEAAKNLIIK